MRVCVLNAGDWCSSDIAVTQLQSWTYINTVPAEIWWAGSENAQKIVGIRIDLFVFDRARCPILEENPCRLQPIMLR